MPTITGKVNERGEFERQKELEKYFASNCNRVVVVDLKRYMKPRSGQQNRAVMGFWLGIIMAETGHQAHEKDGLYQAIKSRCWYRDVVSKKTGEVIQEPKPTKDLSTDEYSKFMESFRSFVLDFFGIYLPDPIASQRFL